MRSIVVLSLALFGTAVPVAPTTAASFDCTKASTPFEHAICDNPDLSAADDRLARTYATASGGLSEAALGRLRSDQRAWLGFAQSACNDDVKPLQTGRYDADGVSCLTSLFASRSKVLEASRMIDGLRFYPVTEYLALPDPEAEPGSTWMVAQHDLATIQLDEDLDYARAFNDLVLVEGQSMQGSGEAVVDDGSSDSSYAITVAEVSSTMITLNAETYWYGHGGAHGNYTTSFLHFLTEEQRWMEAGDLFSGKKWQQGLLDLAVEALRKEHGDMLMLDTNEYIVDAVADPRRWDLSNPYGLVIQFQPYEVAAYAYGAPTATIRWEDLQAYFSETGSKYGYVY